VRKALVVSLLLHTGILFEFLKFSDEWKRKSRKTIDTILVEKSVSFKEHQFTAHTQVKANTSIIAPQSSSLKAMTIESSESATAEGLQAESGGDYRPSPLYPELALEEGLEGEVILKLETNAEGGVITAEMKKSSGHSILDEEAFKTVKKWRLTPSIKVIVPIRFQLSSTDVSETPN
jgi:TonB family protein